MTTWKGRLGQVALFMAIVGAVVLPLAGFGNRYGLWGFQTGFGVAAFAGVVLLLAAVLGLIAIIGSLFSEPREGIKRGGFALLIVLAVLIVPLNMVRTAFSGQYPAIHDITTDTEDPPEFIAVLPERQGLNSVVYSEKALPEGERFGDLAGAPYPEVQARYYPDIQPVVLALTPAEAFDKALATAEARGWKIVASVADDGRIEATDMTFWFGFKDDVVIRIRGEGAGSRVDIRSTSRVGLGDVGANANRIRAYIEALTAG